MCFEIFCAECQKKTLGKEALCRVLKKHSAKSLFAECQKKTLGKGVFAECPKNNTRQTTWHSAKSRSPVVILIHKLYLIGVLRNVSSATSSLEVQ